MCCVGRVLPMHGQGDGRGQGGGWSLAGSGTSGMDQGALPSPCPAHAPCPMAQARDHHQEEATRQCVSCEVTQPMARRGGMATARDYRYAAQPESRFHFHLISLISSSGAFNSAAHLIISMPQAWPDDAS